MSLVLAKNFSKEWRICKKLATERLTEFRIYKRLFFAALCRGKLEDM